MANGNNGLEQPLTLAEVKQALHRRSEGDIELAFHTLNAIEDDVLDERDIAALRKRPPPPADIQWAVDTLAIHLDETASTFDRECDYLGRMAGFLKGLGKALDHRPVLAMGHTAAGEVAWAANDYDKAVEELSVAAKLTPEEPATAESPGAAALANLVLAEAKLGKAVADARVGKMAWGFYGEGVEAFLSPAEKAVRAWLELAQWQEKVGASLPAEIEGFVAEVQELLKGHVALQERFKGDAAVGARLERLQAAEPGAD
jgi:tetratricopeptide (TPR) repeat protein